MYLGGGWENGCVFIGGWVVCVCVCVCGLGVECVGMGT